MPRYSLLAAPAVVAALALLAALPAPADGCAAAPPRGETVSVADEAALIVWDEKTKTEHFVRRANFTSTAYDFGFLVPTPTRPHLDLADDSVFSDLSGLTAPKVEYQTVVKEVNRDFDIGCSESKSASHGAAADKMAPNSAPRAGGVSVLEQKKLGDYDVSVLKFRRGTIDTPASGAAELTKWLSKHGYEASEAIQKWLERYVQDEWCITAFKIGAKPTADDPHAPKLPPGAASGRERHALRAKPVRMSFQTERPFYPYREPLAAPSPPDAGKRLLRVFVASSSRVAGTLGDGAKAWPGQTVWAGSVAQESWGVIFNRARLTPSEPSDGGAVVMPQPGAGWWLTEFEDRSSPRPGTDEVYFAPSTDASPVERPKVIYTRTEVVYRTPWWHVAVYLGVPAALVLGALGAWRLARRA